MPVTDELLSSWSNRHADLYAVPPLVMLRHCLPEAHSLRAADLHLSADQEIRLAKVFATEPAVVRRMTFTNVARSSRRLIAVRRQQSCPNCSAHRTEPEPILRSQLVGWRLTCPVCGGLFRDTDGRALPSPFRQYRDAACRGEQLLDDEAERGIATWTSPAEIARLLLMRRIPRPIPRESDLWRFRVIGAINDGRSKYFPDAPTMAEQGFAEAQVTPWFGLVVPARTPQAVVERISKALEAALATPDVREKLDIAGCEAKSAPLAQFADIIKAAGLPVKLIDLSTTGRISGADVPPLEIALHHPRGSAGIFNAERGAAVGVRRSQRACEQLPGAARPAKGSDAPARHRCGPLPAPRRGPIRSFGQEAVPCPRPGCLPPRRHRAVPDPGCQSPRKPKEA